METVKLEQLRTFVVGVDPGTNTGFAFYNRKTSKLLLSGTANFCRVIDLIEQSFPHKDEVTIFVELPSKFLYDRNDVQDGIVRDRKNQFMASVRREAELMIAMLRHKGFDQVVDVPPVHGAKWTQEKFRLFTGSRKQTNEHERDAVRLAIHYSNKRKEI